MTAGACEPWALWIDVAWASRSVSSSRTSQRQAAPVVAGEDDGVLVAVVVDEDAALAVHELALVVVARLDDAVADAQRRAGDRLAVRVEPRAQLVVERVDPDRAAVHRREHLHLGDRVEAVVARAAGAAARSHDLGEDRRRVLAADEEEVAQVALATARGRELARC